MDKRVSLVDDKEIEALELSQRFANDTGIDVTDSRPCIARLFYEGVPGGGAGRKMEGFVVALELKVAGLPFLAISKHMEAFSSRCDPPILKNDLAHILRNIQKSNYDKRKGCEKLEDLCIGDICPFKGKGEATLSLRQQSGPTAFVSMGWIGYISGTLTKVYLALLDLRIRRGFEPNAFFSFYFGELERRSGVSRGHMRDHLEALLKLGLIEKLEIGLKWNSGKRQRTKVRLASPIPDPVRIGLKLLKASEHEL